MRFVAQAMIAAAVLAGSVSSPAFAQRNFDQVTITAEPLAEGVAVLYGAGGNIAISYGPDGTLMVDDQFAPLSARIERAIADLGAAPVRYLVNTHWHGDHTGSNAEFAQKGATIFAHRNVRIRLMAPRTGPDGPSRQTPAAALPVVTFDRGITFYLNGDTIDVMFIGGGHTDGDAIVRWREKNIVHMGDLYFNISGWPFVDVASGGDIENLLFSLDSAIAMIDEDTQVIPGHGKMSNRAQLIAYRNTLGEAVTRIRALRDAGYSLDQARARKPLASFARGKGFVEDDAFIEAVWRSLD